MPEMTSSMRMKLRRIEVMHEGYRQFPYEDTTGHLTVGIGYNLTDRGMPDDWIEKQFNEDIDFFYTQLSKQFSWFDDLNEARQIALIDMCFMGFKKLLSFKKMFMQMASKRYDLAAREVLDSKWASQVGNRAETIAKMIEFGEFVV